MNKKNRVILALAIGAVLILIGSTAVRCTLAQQPNDLTTEVPENTETQHAEEASSDQADLEVRDLLGNENEPLSNLKQNAWVAEDGKATITFKDGRFVETNDETTKMTTFDVDSVIDQTNQTTITITIDEADGATREGVLIVRQNDAGILSVASDSFLLAKSYIQGEANSSPLQIEGINDEFRELIGKNVDQLQSAISEYAYSHAPTATAATWDKSLIVDYNTNEVFANFTLNDTAATVLTVEYSRDSAIFAVVG